jgi:hypothetical protein
MVAAAVAKFRRLSYGGNNYPAIALCRPAPAKGGTVPAKVEYLQKIRLSVKTGSAADPEKLTESFPPVEFVYGLSASGLTPFEYALAEKLVGDEIQLQLHKNQLKDFFGHIQTPIIDPAVQSDSILLKARILKIAPANSREVVKTLADIANCGDSCCGHH